MNPVGACLQRWTGVGEYIATQLQRHASIHAQAAAVPDGQRHTTRQAPSGQPAFQQGQIYLGSSHGLFLTSACMQA
jgi:hypothetical protein